MQPKSDGINDAIRALTGKDRESTIRGCMTCEGNAVAFKDALSLREYQISGMCQECQDATFA